jgi:ABC-type phosphate/phosphonate transport system substrate-binding protein
MNRRRSVIVCAVLTVAALILVPALPGAEHAQTAPGTVKICLVNSLFRDVPASMVQLLMPPFKNLMRDQTGLEGEVVTAADPDELGRRLTDKDVQLGVFQGFEFAWVHEKYPALRPLMVALNRHPTLQASVVVLSDGPTANLAGLKGKPVGISKRTLDHCLLFLDRECMALGNHPKDFFSSVTKYPSYEDALDDLLRGKVDGVLVDALGLENYANVKPGCFARLKVIKHSEAFPPAVVVYRDGAVDNKTLAKFRAGMIGARDNVRAKELMSLWRISSFENVPGDFPQLLAGVNRAYPPPIPAPAANAPRK